MALPDGFRRIIDLENNMNEVSSQLSDVALNVKAFGAIGNGQSHPLSGYFSTLAEAQVVYPKATALTNEIDGCAIQKAIDSGYKVYIPKGDYFVNQAISITKSKMKILGASQRSTTIWYKGTDSNGKVFYLNGCPFTYIESLNVYSADKKGIGVYVENNTGNIYIRDFGCYYMNKGVYYGSGSYIHYIENANFYGCAYGIQAGWEFNSVHMIKLSCGACDIGVEVGQGRTVVIDNSQFELNTIGIKKLNGGDVVIKNTYFEANITNAVQVIWGVESAEAVVIDSCSFYIGASAVGAEISYHMAEGRHMVIQNCLFKTGVEAAYCVEQYQTTYAKFSWVNNTLLTGVSIMQNKSLQQTLRKNIEQTSIYSRSNGIYFYLSETTTGSKSYKITTNAVAGDTVTINSITFTAVASGATGNQFNIGATTFDTATNLKTALNSNATINTSYVAISANNSVILTEKVPSQAHLNPTNATTTGTIVIANAINITVKNLLSLGIQCFRFLIDSGNITVTLPKIDLPIDFPTITFFFGGTSDVNNVTFLMEGTPNTYMTNVRTLALADVYKKFEIACIRADGTTTQYVLL